MYRVVILIVIGLFAALPAWAQSPTASIGVGSGALAVDPSKNVLDALLAAVTRLNDLAIANKMRGDDLREADAKIQNSLRDAETRRVNELSSQKQVFDLELARGIRANVDASALLLATQVRELKTDTSDRVAKLEQFANEQRGRASAGNEVWALIGVLAMLLLVAIGIIVNLVKSTSHNHERDDAERYRQYIDRKVSEKI